MDNNLSRKFELISFNSERSTSIFDDQSESESLPSELLSHIAGNGRKRSMINMRLTSHTS